MKNRDEILSVSIYRPINCLDVITICQCKMIGRWYANCKLNSIQHCSKSRFSLLIAQCLIYNVPLTPTNWSSMQSRHIAILIHSIEKITATQWWFTFSKSIRLLVYVGLWFISCDKTDHKLDHMFGLAIVVGFSLCKRCYMLEYAWTIL